MDRFPLPLVSHFVGWSLLAISSVMGAELPNAEMKISRGVEAGAWQLGWQGAKGWTYFLQQSPNAWGWSYVPWMASGNDGPLGLTVRSAAGAGFFRLRATGRSAADPWTADFDGDRVGNGDELLQGTDPLSAADADANGLPDDWEQFYFGHSGVDPQAIAPGGEMTNLQHFTLGSNPNNPPQPPTIIPGPVTLDLSADTPLYPTAIPATALTVAGGSIGAASGSGELIVNGNFNSPSLGDEDWAVFAGIPGWRAISMMIAHGSMLESLRFINPFTRPIQAINRRITESHHSEASFLDKYELGKVKKTTAIAGLSAGGRKIGFLAFNDQQPTGQALCHRA